MQTGRAMTEEERMFRATENAGEGNGSTETGPGPPVY